MLDYRNHVLQVLYVSKIERNPIVYEVHSVRE